MGETEREILIERKYLRLLKQGSWEYVERVGMNGVVVIVPVTDNNEIVLTEQYRTPLGQRVIELPAGLAADGGRDGESLEEAARRELIEETGYQAKTLQRVGSGPTSSGLTNEVVTFFRARGLRRVGKGGGDDSEEIEVHVVPLERIVPWVKQKSEEGRLIEVNVYAGIFFAQSYGTVADFETPSESR